MHHPITDKQADLLVTLTKKVRGNFGRHINAELYRNFLVTTYSKTAADAEIKNLNRAQGWDAETSPASDEQMRALWSIWAQLTLPVPEPRFGMTHAEASDLLTTYMAVRRVEKATGTLQQEQEHETNVRRVDFRRAG